GFTDALRMEVEEAKLPVSVTLIKPAAIDTPYTAHAKNYMEDFPNNPPPVYAPELVAETILYAAEHPVRDLFVGGAGKAFQVMEHTMPRATDKFMEKALFRQLHSGKPKRQQDGLHAASNDMRERGDYDGMVRETSTYTAAMTHPKTTALLALVGLSAAAAGVAALLLHEPRPQSTTERVTDYLRRAPRRLGRAAERAGDQARGYAREYLPSRRQVSDSAEDAWDSARDTAGNVVAKATKAMAVASLVKAINRFW
ncbi:MAG: hypothetical protein AVDCRST_MAG64-4128, partial [uncultured Phycisphaerae bacterium]